MVIKVTPQIYMAGSIHRPENVGQNGLQHSGNDNAAAGNLGCNGNTYKNSGTYNGAQPHQNGAGIL